MYIHMYIHLYIHMYIHMDIHMYTHMHIIHMYIHMHIHMYIQMYIHMYIHMYLHMKHKKPQKKERKKLSPEARKQTITSESLKRNGNTSKEITQKVAPPRAPGIPNCPHTCAHFFTDIGEIIFLIVPTFLFF